jgi:hypothetical protein
LVIDFQTDQTIENYDQMTRYKDLRCVDAEESLPQAAARECAAEGAALVAFGTRLRARAVLLTDRQIEARVAMTRFIARGGKTGPCFRQADHEKAPETRMGSARLSMGLRRVLQCSRDEGIPERRPASDEVAGRSCRFSRFAMRPNRRRCYEGRGAARPGVDEPGLGTRFN